MDRKVRENLYEYFINTALSLVIVFSALEGFKFHFSWSYVVIITAVFTASFYFLLRRPFVLIFLITLLLVADLILFFGYRDVLINVFLYIEGFFRWIIVYMNQAPSSWDFYFLTEKYKVFTLFVTAGIVTFLITLINGLAKNWFLTLFLGMTFFVIQWYNYVDKAYFYLMVYILLGFTDIGVKNYFKSNGIKAPISIFLAIVIFFSSISAFGAELMPKAFSPLKWDKLEEWFYDTFPFTREWRNGVGKEEGAVAEETFFTFTSDLGGPVKALNSVVMKVVGDEATYLRGLVYDQYVTSPLGKSRWSNHSQQYEYKEVGEVLPVTFSEKVKYQVKSLKIIPVNIRSDILFSPWQPYEVSDAFYYEKDNFNLKAKTSHATGGSYVVTYLKPQIDLKDLKEKGSTNLSEEDKKRYLSYPLDLPERVKELAYSITKDKTNQYDKVKAVEEYLRRLPYSLDVPPVPAGRDFVDYFLFDLKKGYCTHYATAMAVMLRTIGIPTRYVVGFKMPHFTNKSGEYVITMAEAHSWVEVYFDDYGWVTFEPTPYYPSIEFPIFSSYSSSNIYGEDILPDNKEEVNPKGSDGIPLPEEKSNPSSAKSVSTDEKSKLIKAVVSFALLCTSLVTLVWSIIKLRRKKELYRHEKKVIIYYYDKILKKLSNKGFKMEDFETTIEYGMRVAEAGYEDFIEITDIYNRIVYGSKKPSAAEIKRMKEFFDSLNRRGKFDIKRILRI